MRKLLSAVAVLGLVGTTVARADSKDFFNRCSTGSLHSCASLVVITTLNGSGGTDVVIRVRNLGGTYFYDNTGGSVLVRIGLLAPSITLANTNLGIATSGTVGVQGNPAPNWFLRNPGGLGSPIELTAGITPGTTSGGILGCGTPAHGNPSSYFKTCDPTGWVEFSFSTTNAWSANDAEVAWLQQDFGVNGGGIECGSDTSGLANNARQYCVGVTPEPMTMVLLGSGLAGMSGFGFMKRRKKDEQIG